MSTRFERDRVVVLATLAAIALYLASQVKLPLPDFTRPEPAPCCPRRTRRRLFPIFPDTREIDP